MPPSCFFSYCLLQIFVHSFLPLQDLRFAFRPYFYFQCSCLCSRILFLLAFLSIATNDMLMEYFSLSMILCPGSLRLLCGLPFVVPGPVPLLLIMYGREIIDSKLYWPSCVPILFCCTCSLAPIILFLL